MMPDLSAVFDAMEGLPLALVWGLNSNASCARPVDKMQKRRPDLDPCRGAGRGPISRF